MARQRVWLQYTVIVINVDISTPVVGVLSIWWFTKVANDLVARVLQPGYTKLATDHQYMSLTLCDCSQHDLDGTNVVLN